LDCVFAVKKILTILTSVKQVSFQGIAVDYTDFAQGFHGHVSKSVLQGDIATKKTVDVFGLHIDTVTMRTFIEVRGNETGSVT
jgi:hypothetical protein